MNPRLIIPALIAATCAVGGFSTPVNADGLFGWVPIVGPLGDDLSREWQRRDSDASVGSQALCGVGCWGFGQPIGRPYYQSAPPPPQYGYGPTQYYRAGAYGAYGYAPQYRPAPRPPPQYYRGAYGAYGYAPQYRPPLVYPAPR
jgi:hypothetical protein